MKASIATALLGLGMSAMAVNQQCETTACYSLEIPDATASSGKGDIYFQIKAPTSNAWVALGQGTSMTGATIFVVYQNAAGTNVTLSPRLGTGHVQPQFSATINATLLPGSGVIGGNIVANVKCSSCASKADFTKGAGDWIFAYKAGTAIKSDSTSAAISIHSAKGAVVFDYAASKGGNGTFPTATTIRRDAEPQIRGASWRSL